MDWGLGAADGGSAPAPVTVAEETDLIRRILTGDAEAFSGLVDAYMAVGYRTAYRVLGHRQDAEDVLQDAFLQALRHIDQFEVGRPFLPWFLRIVVNRALSIRGRLARRAADELSELEVDPSPGPALVTERADAGGRVRAALAALPERERMAVQLVELEGMTSAEAGEVLELPAGTVRWLLHRARNELRMVLAPTQDWREGHYEGTA